MPFGLISGIINSAASMKTAVDNKMNAAADREQQMYINHLNWMRTNEIIDKNRNWELEDQKRLEEREDTAIQRRMADLEKAGINPLLAGGIGGASSGIISGKNTSLYTPAQATTTPQQTAPQIDIGDPLQRKLEREEKLAQIENIEADTKAKKEGTKGTQHDNTRKEIENEYRREQIQLDIEKMTKGNALTEQQTKNLIQTHLYNATAEQRAKAMHEIDKAGKMLDNELKKLNKEITELEKQGITEENAREQERFEMLKKERWLFYLDTISSSLTRITDMADKVKNMLKRKKR